MVVVLQNFELLVPPFDMLLIDAEGMNQGLVQLTTLV